MKSPLLEVAIRAVRGWTRLYTWRMPPAQREARRAEIESDVWEFEQDTPQCRSISPSVHMLIRLLAGVPDDLRWRMDQAAVEGTRAHGSVALSASAFGALLFACVLWAIETDAARKRSAFGFAAPTVALEQAKLTPLAAGIVATVGASMMPRLAAQRAIAGADVPPFEAASIKPNRAGSPLVMMMPQPGGRFTATNVSLRILIQNAYQLPAFRIETEGAPEWLGSARFDVAAKAYGDPPPEQIRFMLQKLLAERFNLTVHRETRQLPVFDLVISRRDGRIGPQLRPTKADCARVLPAPGPPSADNPPLCGYFGPAPGIPMASGRSMMAIRGVTMDRFARFLEPSVRRSVIDRTGLSGYFDGEFDFAAELPPPPPPPGISDPFDRQSFPTIFTVIHEQLGLKLDSERGAVEVLVIDSAQQPTPD